MIGFDTNILMSYFQAKAGLSAGLLGGASGTALTPAANQKKAPTAPWSSLSTEPKADELMKKVLMGRKFVNEDTTQLDVKGASDDYRQLFAMHQGLATLQSLAEKANQDGLSTTELRKIQAAFDRGVQEVSAYIDQTKFDKLRLTYGDTKDKAKSAVGVPKTVARYTTKVLHEGSADTPVESFQGEVKFSVLVKRLNNTSATVDFDLAEMGATPRTMNNVVKYMNDKMAQTGYYSRFAVEKTAGVDKTMTVNGRTIVTAKGKDQFALKIQGDTTEELTFSAPATAPAVYLTQTAGDPNPDGKPATDDAELQQEFLKFETGTASDAVRRPGDTNWVEGRVFGGAMPKGVETVRSQVTGPDGAIYMLADVNDTVDGQTIKGQSDVALMKFDSAGNLVYTRTLGASDNATGLAMTVGADGKIAIAGSITGGITTSLTTTVSVGTGTLTTGVYREEDGDVATVADSFVTVFNDKGEELWTQRKGARAEDEASGVAFGADGSVYVVGRAKGSMPGSTASGGWDNYLRTFSADGKLKSTSQFGTAGEDKMAGLVVDGTDVVVASIEGGEAKLRRFDVSDINAPVLGATRSLGSLGGGTIAGVALDGGGNVVLAGSTGADLSVGATTRAKADSVDAFALKISADLTSTTADKIAYYGGAGDDRATAMTVANGKVWLTGTSKAPLPNLPTTVGKADGFAVELDIDTGQVGWSQRFTGKDGYGAPTSISVDAAGSSVLDRLGLPTGPIEYADSQLITSATSARAGDSFQIRTRPGARPVTITIEAEDTLDKLVKKIQRATYFQVKAEVSSGLESRSLQIRPINSRSSIEILGGKGGLDALESLGLHEGFVRTTKVEDDKIVPSDGGAPMYGLKLARDLSIDSKEAIKATIDELTQATAVIRTAYRDLQAGLNPQANKPKVNGEVPAYLKDQIANYQAALVRLTGGMG
jgi:hypothetical protein